MKTAAIIPPNNLSTSAVSATTLFASLSIVAIGSLGPNIELACLSAVTLLFGVAMLWRSGEPPILLFVFLFQWLQGSVAIIQATLVEKPIDEFFEGGGQAAEATALTLLALAALAIGMRIGAGRVRQDLLQFALAQASHKSMRSWFAVFVVGWLAGIASFFGVAYSGGLSQVFFSLTALRWAFFFMLAVVHFSRGRKAGFWFPAAFAIEFGMSIGGYFSDFKTVFIVTFLAMLMAGVRVTAQRVLAAGAIAAVALGLGIIWTAIKNDYRIFASDGEISQGVAVGYPERIGKLAELVAALDDKRIEEATGQLLSRLSYVEYFGSVIDHVPAVVPHEGGDLLADAVTRPFMPRFLFPDKPGIDDSERTRFYTGRFVAGAKSGTSISLGWAAEEYIDFGRWGMMAAGVGVGVLYGLVFRLFTTWSRSRGLLGYGVGVALLIVVAFLETSFTKILGGIVVSLLVSLMVIRFVLPVWIPWLVRTRA